MASYKLSKASSNDIIGIYKFGIINFGLNPAKDYLNSKVLAVDLSLSSLSYAKRKTDELAFKNIEYLNADILPCNINYLGVN